MSFKMSFHGGGACQWCGRPATKEVELVPGRVGTFTGRAKPIMPRKVEACDYHAEMIDEDRGWQERNRWRGTQLGMEV